MARSTKALILGGAALGASAGALALRTAARRNRSRVEADPAHARLTAELDGRSVDVAAPDGTALHAEVFGPEDAPTIVLTHGWTCALGFWTLQIQELSRDYRVVGWDLRGHGRSAEPVERDYSIETFAGDLETVLAATVPDGERVVLAGHSMGAMTIVAWADAHREELNNRVAAVALLNTGMGGLLAESLVLRTPPSLRMLEDVVGKLILTAPGPLPQRPGPLTNAAVSYMALGPDASPAEIEFCERLVLACGPGVRAGAGSTLSRLDLTHAVANVDVPAVVVAGERDRLTPPVHAHRMVETLPGPKRYLELAGSGHMSPIEFPYEVTDVLRELLEEHLVGDRRADGARTKPEAVSP
jgi:pimeloyl-ACP methyl ester carboxylesterase